MIMLINRSLLEIIEITEILLKVRQCTHSFIEIYSRDTDIPKYKYDKIYLHATRQLNI